MKKTRFVIIHFSTKKKFELSLNEYALLELVYYYSTNPESAHQGWCYASKKHLGECIDVSSRTIIKLLNKLEEEGFIQKSMEGKLIRTTKKWNMTKFTHGEESSHGSEKSSSNNGEESSVETVKNVHTNSKENRTLFNNTEKKDRKTKFSPPTIEEVILDFTEKGSNKIEGEKFFHFYDSKNWMVGKSKMKKWKSAVSGWIARNKKSSPAGDSVKQYDYGTNEGW